VAKKYSRMPIEQSPWIEHHNLEDVENYIKYFQELATSIDDLLDDNDTRNFGPFLNGAQQAVERYNITTRAHKMTKNTTFRFSELKDPNKVTTIFIIPDVSRLEAQKPVLEIWQYCLFQELKRHKNKDVLVHFILDEANNFKIKDLESLLTWGRGYGFRFQIYIQNYASFRKLYGKEAVSVLQSETEIKLYLPSQREPETLTIIEKSLGDNAYVGVGRSGNVESQDYEITGKDYREDARPLMTVDEIRRMDKAILFIRRNRPMQVHLPSIAAIEPFRDLTDINPYHGKPYFLPVELKINRDGQGRFSKLRRMFGKLFHRNKRQFEARKKHLSRMATLSWRTSTLIEHWWVLLLIAFFISPIGPHLRWSYEYRQCTYLGSRGFISPNISSDCPLLVVIDSRPWTKQ